MLKILIASLFFRLELYTVEELKRNKLRNLNLSEAPFKEVYDSANSKKNRLEKQ